MGENIACLEQFHGEIVQFNVYLWDFVRKMHGWTILAFGCHVSHPLWYFINT